MENRMLTAQAAAVVVIVATVGIQGCWSLPPGNVCEGFENLCSGVDPNPISTFDGEWLSTEFAYAVRITSRIGNATLSSSAAYNVGDTILVITADDQTGFTARHTFNNGSVQEVTVKLIDAKTLFLTGGGSNWTMVKIAN